MLRANIRVCLLALAVLLTSGVSTLRAAIVFPRTGEVRVNEGQGFRKIDAPTTVAAGAMVMVGPDGSATIQYGDACTIRVGSAAIAIVQSTPSCSSFTPPSHLGFEEYRVGEQSAEDPFGFSPKVGTSQRRRSADDDCELDHRRLLLILGGVAVAGGIIAAAVLASQGSDNPTSP